MRVYNFVLKFYGHDFNRLLVLTSKMRRWLWWHEPGLQYNIV